MIPREIFFLWRALSSSFIKGQPQTARVPLSVLPPSLPPRAELAPAGHCIHLHGSCSPVSIVHTVIQILRDGGGCYRNAILQFSSSYEPAPSWSQCPHCSASTIQLFQFPLAFFCQSESKNATATPTAARRKPSHRRAGRHVQGGHPRRGGRGGAGALPPGEDVAARLGAAPLRHCQRQRCRRGSQPLQHPGAGRRVHRQGRARQQLSRRGRGGHCRRRAQGGRRDAGRRSLQRQRRGRQGARGGGGGHRAGGAGPHHQRPGELDRPGGRRGAEAEGRVRPAEALRRDDARRRPREHVRRREEEPPARRRRRAGHRRPRGRHRPAAAVEGAAQGGVHGRGGRGAHRAGPERRRRGSGIRDAVRGVRGRPVRGGVAARPRRRRQRVRVRVRAVPAGRGAAVLRVQGQARERRRRGGGRRRAQGAVGLRGARAGCAEAPAQGEHRQGRRLRAAAANDRIVELKFCSTSGIYISYTKLLTTYG